MPDASPGRADAERSCRAFVEACDLDVLARKPGNVSVASPGHRMHADQFRASARAAAMPLCTPSAGVGERIEAAVRATRGVVRCNTNLGIVLLCAPLVAAQERRAPSQALREAVGAVLASLTVADARAAYRAIVLAGPAGLGSAAPPAGLGSAPDQDVVAEPTVGLRAAMALAAGRDRVARQYAQDFADVFGTGLAAFVQARGLGADPRQAMQHAFLAFLATAPDSHIARKHGDAAAHSVMAEARPWHERARRGEPLDADPAWAAWDESLKARGLNPGTSADLCVATALTAALGAHVGVSTQTTRHEI